MQSEGRNGTAKGSRSALDDLTPQQLRVALLLGEGRSLTAITQHLSIAQSTLDKHLAGLREKLEVESTIEVAALAARASLSKQTSPLDSTSERLGKSPESKGSVPSLLDPGLSTALENHLCSHPLEEVGAVAYRFLPRGVRSLRIGSALAALATPAGTHASASMFQRMDTLRELDRELLQWAGTKVDRLCSANKSENDRFAHHFFFRDGPSLVGFSFLRRKNIAGHINTGHASHDGHGSTGTKLEIWSRAFQEGVSKERGLAKAVGLTPSECETLGLIAEGESVYGVSQRQGGCERNVARILRRAREKLHARTNAEAVSEAMALHALEFS